MKKVQTIGIRLLVLVLAATQFAMAMGIPSTLGGK